MYELLLSHDQLRLVSEVIEDTMNKTREDCWLFDVGSRDWNELVGRPYRSRAVFYVGSSAHECAGWVVSPMYPGIADTARSWLIIGMEV